MVAGHPGLSATQPARLSRCTLERLARDVRRPAYEAQRHGAGIVHLGVGAFMRAHVAEYTDDALGARGGDWRITGVSLRSPAVSEQLMPQDGLYTMAVCDTDSVRRRLIGALDHVLVAPRDPDAVIRALADPAVRIVTLTVTEKGYCLDPASGQLLRSHPGIAHDLEHPARPATTIGFLVAGLARRRECGSDALTLLSCDNLPGNGTRLKNAVLGFAAALDPALHDWIARCCSFPHSMVDRIVPATVERDLADGERALGLHDAAVVRTEPFRQWVIEDNFVAGRPAWEAGGALFVADVAPFEAAKLQLLNGPHSTIAYLGHLAGFEFVHEVVRQDDYRCFLRYVMTREIAPVTPQPDGMRHDRYIDALLARFANASLRHRTWQIAMDGSQKLPQRLLAPLRLQLERGGPIDGLSLAIAGFMRYALGRDDGGRPIEISDPLAARFQAIAARGLSDPAGVVAAFLGLRDIFGADLAGNRRFAGSVTAAYEHIAAGGAARAVRSLVQAAGLSA